MFNILRLLWLRKKVVKMTARLEALKEKRARAASKQRHGTVSELDDQIRNLEEELEEVIQETRKHL